MTWRRTAMVGRGISLALLVAGTFLPGVARGASSGTEYELIEGGDGTFDDKGTPSQDPLVRILNVADSFTISDLDVGMVVEHTWRGDVRVTLKSPAGTSVEIIALSTTIGSDHFDVLLDSASGGNLDDGTDHNLAAPFYEHSAAPSNSLNDFNGENAQGNWTFEFTDLQLGATSERVGIFHRTKLIFNSAGVAPLVVRLFDDRDWDGDYQPLADTNVIAGATVRIFDANGDSMVGTDCGDGTYTFDPSGTLAGNVFRVEVDAATLPAGYEPGIVHTGLGANAGPLVQKVDLSGGQVIVNIPVQIPKVACLQPGDLDLFTTCFVGGPRDSMTPVDMLDENSNTVTIIPALSPAVVVADRSSAGPSSPTPERYLATIQEVGAVYGVAVQESQDRAYVSAFIKRHTEIGPDGSGAIYVLGSAGGGVLDTFTIPNAGSVVQGADATGTFATGTHGGWLRDSNTFGAVGKEALGDVEINAAKDTLWVINLNDRRLYMIDVATPYTPSYGTVTALGSVADPGCPDPDDWRPFALEWHDGNLYLGGTCTAQSTGDPADLAFRIFRVDNPTTPAATPATPIAMTEVFSTAAGALQYDRGDADAAWHPWIDAWDVNLFANPSYASFAQVYPQPWLTDFEFDNNNSLILGIRDRFGDQIGINTQSPGTDGTGDPASETGLFETVSMGEIIHAEFSAGSGAADVTNAVLGDWTLEFEAGFTGPLRDDPNDAFDPGPGEFYFRTSFQTIHPETAQGAVAFHPDWPDQIVTTSQDPFALRSGGFAFFYTADEPTGNLDFTGPTGIDDSGTSPYQNGNGSGGIQVYGGQNTGAQVEQSLFGKANGLGDLEYGCGLTVLQIGDCVWLDENHDGVQDPNEVPIPGVTVSLYVDLDSNGIYDDLDATPGPDPIATTTTGTDGCYYFDARPVTHYGIAFDLSTVVSLNDSQEQPVNLANLAPTNSDVTGGDSNDGNDSDLNISIEGQPAIALLSDGIGVSNHTSDAGFTENPLVGIGNLVFVDANRDGVYTAGIDTAAEGVDIELWDPGADGLLDGNNDTLVASITTGTGPAAGCYSFYTDPGNYIVHIPETEFAGGAPLDGLVSTVGQDSDDLGRADDNASGQDNGSDNPTPASGGVSSVLINLAIGSEPSGAGESGKDGSGDDSGDLDVDYTVDFGFRIPCSIDSVVASNVQRDDNGTPITTDDTFTFDVTVTVTGGSPGGWSSSNPNGGGAYGVAVGYGPFPVSGGGITVNVVDDADLACTGQVIVNPPSVPEVALGDLVFCDENNDGQFQSGTEAGINGVLVQLLYDSTGDGDFDDPGEATPVASDTTAGGGLYSFPNLTPGTYQVVIPLSNFQGGGALEIKTLSSTLTDPGDNGEDGDDNGDQPGGAGTVTSSPPITLATGQEPGTGGGGNTDNTVDFGFDDPVGLGNLVWIETNGVPGYQAGVDTAVEGAVVELWSPGPDGEHDGGGDDDVLVAAGVTGTGAAAGCYAFLGLGDGVYFVKIPSTEFAGGEPLYRAVSLSGAGGDTDIDDQADENGLDAADPTATGVDTGLIALDGGSEPDNTSELGKDNGADGSNELFFNSTVDLGFRIPKATNYDDYLADAGLPPGTTSGQPIPDGSGSGGNPDGDWSSNLLEHAFCDTPTSGVPNHPGFCVELNTIAPGRIDASFIRPEGVQDVIYTLQGADSMLGPWFTIASIPAGQAATSPFGAVSNGDETETVTFINLESAPGYSATTFGFARLCVSLDSEPDGNPDSVQLPSDPSGPFVELTDCTRSFGWQCVDYNLAQCASHSHPFTNKPVFSGRADGNTAATATVDATVSAGGVDLATLNLGPIDLDPGPGVQLVPTHFLQVTSGAHEGERFDIASASGGVLTLVNDPDIFTGINPAFNPGNPTVDSLNTNDGVPADDALLNASFQVLPHKTIDQLFDKNGAFAGLQSTSDQTRLLFYENRHEDAGFAALSLADTGTGVKWVYMGDPDAIDQGGRPVDRATGNYVHLDAGGTMVCGVGLVADYDLACPFDEGYNLAGAPYPLDQTPSGLNGRAMTVGGAAGQFNGSHIPSRATELFNWMGDMAVDDTPAPLYMEGYETFMAADDGGTFQQWIDANDPTLADLGTDLNGPLVLPSWRAMTVKMLPGAMLKPHLYPLPGTP